MTITSKGRLCGLHLLACAFFASTWSAYTVAGGYAECVGRYELTFPAAVDVALTTTTAFVNPLEYPIRFPDNQIAPHSLFIYNGIFKITGAMRESDFDLIAKQITDRILSNSGSLGEDKRIVAIPTGQVHSLAWTAQDSAGFYAYESGRAINFRDESPLAQQRAAEVLAHLAVRHVYEIPRSKGVCLPDLFVTDKGSEYARQVGVTYRLKSHPDVTVFFLDAKALPSDPKLTSRQKNEFVWSDEYGIGKRVRLHGPMPYRSIKLDGREGIASFATITRDDGSTDYGYLATVQGDPGTQGDTPNLLLLIERNAKYAKGDSPVSAEELDRIAEGIAASVKRRPVQ